MRPAQQRQLQRSRLSLSSPLSSCSLALALLLLAALIAPSSAASVNVFADTNCQRSNTNGAVGGVPTGGCQEVSNGGSLLLLCGENTVTYQQWTADDNKQCRDAPQITGSARRGASECIILQNGGVQSGSMTVDCNAAGRSDATTMAGLALLVLVAAAMQRALL